jgi:hypothetical protein
MTRETAIPLDLAPAKLWYPDYYKNGRPLEMLMTLGDLERSMDFGEGEPAQTMGWIFKTVGQNAFSSVVIDDGEVPLAPIWAVKDAIKAQLKNCL